MAQQNGPLPQSPQIWLPSADSFGLDAPNSTHLWYVCDKTQFAKLGKQRQVFIRHHILGEFPSTHAHAPPLWVLVARFLEWHLRVPIWRGPELNWTNLRSDAAVMLTTWECISLGGHDHTAIEEWRRAPNA